VRKIWRQGLRSLVPYDAGKPLEQLAAELGVPELARLSANENPLGPSPRVVEAVAREAARVHLYPDGGATALRAALARRLGVTPGELLVGNGADELIGLIARAAFEPGDEVVVPEPSFEPYGISATIAGARAVPSPLAGYATDLEDVRRKVTDRTTAVMLCSPHNPTATIVREKPLRAFLDALGDDPPLVILDEAYRDFVDDPEYPDGVALLRRHPRLILLRTFSKIAALAGLRVGYAVARAETLDWLNRVREPYNVNRLGQVAALTALEDEAHWERSRRFVIEERRFLSEGLGRRGYTFPPSQSNFLLVKVPEAAALREKLLRAGILVRDGADVGFPGHLRISVGLRATNEKLLSLL